MSAPFCSLRSRSAAIHNRSRNCRGAIALLWLLVLACGVAAAQTTTPTTTISGTVYDPRLAAGMPNPLPLPNVLVYASTTPVTPPTSGAQCLTYANQMPTGANVVNYTYTAVDGTFTLQNIPENAIVHHRDSGGKMAAPVQRDSGNDGADRAATGHAGQPHSGQHAVYRHRHRLGGWRRMRAARYGHRRLGVY